MSRASAALRREENSAAARLIARPCWWWCGRGSPGPTCHPASRYGAPPTSPCFACGRPLFRCQSEGFVCGIDCDEVLRGLRAGNPGEVAQFKLERAWYEEWDERAAILEFDAGLARLEAERTALVGVWRRFRQGGGRR